MHLASQSIAPGQPSRQVLPGEIRGAQTFFHILEKNQALSLPALADQARVLIVCAGNVLLAEKKLAARDLAAFLPGTALTLHAPAGAQIFELRWLLEPDEQAKDEAFPFFLRYDDAVCYTEDCKSAKTVSRFLLKQRMIPRLAMGSVQTTGYDKIEQHRHPYVEQLFFSFPENDMTLLIDEDTFPMAGNTLVHIPLGSNHGVLAREGQTVHYIWMDFIIDPRGLDYLDEAHEIL